MRLLECVKTNFLFQSVHEDTWYPDNQSPSLLDRIFLKYPDSVFANVNVIPIGNIDPCTLATPCRQHSDDKLTPIFTSLQYDRPKSLATETYRFLICDVD